MAGTGFVCERWQQPFDDPSRNWWNSTQSSQEDAMNIFVAADGCGCDHSEGEEQRGVTHAGMVPQQTLTVSSCSYHQSQHWIYSNTYENSASMVGGWLLKSKLTSNFEDRQYALH